MAQPKCRLGKHPGQTISDTPNMLTTHCPLQNLEYRHAITRYKDKDV